MVGRLFHIETDRVALEWSASRNSPTPVTGGNALPGRLALRAHRQGLTYGSGCWRAGVPESVAAATDLENGPILFEQTDYLVYLEGSDGHVVELTHRDPNITGSIRKQRDGQVVHGTLNFGSQVGRSAFTITVDGRPELTFEVEVFPAKLDYKEDYDRLLADVRDILAGMVFEYLRSTYRLGDTAPSTRSTTVEWLSLLRHLVGELEQALDRVARQPQWALTRTPMATRVERVRRSDMTMRRAIMRGAGTGPLVPTQNGIPIHQQLEERRARQTLDTPEHRWLAAQLARIRQRLADLRQTEGVEMAREPSPRRARIVGEIRTLELRIARLARLSPMAESMGMPPAGFASLQLLSQPGYREAYKTCMLLSLGLSISGGMLELSLKDLSLLYEYWCYLTTIRLVAEETGSAIPFTELFTVEQHGLHVHLQRGRECSVRFGDRHSRVATVTYNRQFKGDLFLVAQQPDILITLSRPAWPEVQLVLDAKYRIDASPEQVERMGTPGPPDDAINALHRYRDAILESADTPHGVGCPKRMVLQAAAAFPYREAQLGAFAKGRLWTALQRLGVGAIPMLPDSTEYLTQWLRTALHQGGWGLSDRAISSSVGDAAAKWRAAAAEPVLVGVLKSGFESEHLQWIGSARTYYSPLRKHQNRQFAVKRLALYEPLALRAPGAVTRTANVIGIEVIERGEIRTPWPSRRDEHELQVVYRLDGFQPLSMLILNTMLADGGARFSMSRWSSVLALERATTLTELFLETEEEWRLYENLKASGIDFQIRSSPALLTDPENPAGRAWFMTAKGRARFQGADGFMIRTPNGDQLRLANAGRVAEAFLRGVESAHY